MFIVVNFVSDMSQYTRKENYLENSHGFCDQLQFKRRKKIEKALFLNYYNKALVISMIENEHCKFSI